MSAPLIVWFRQDLRIFDNPALWYGAQENCPLIPLYIFDDTDSWTPGSASRWWLAKSLESLQRNLKARGVNLILKRGNPEEVLEEIIQKSGARGVYWNRLYDPYSIGRDKKIKAQLKLQKLEVKSFNGALLFEPWELLKSDGTPYQVFTPFWKALLSKGHISEPLPTPEKLIPYPGELLSDDLNAWRFSPTHPNWAKGFETVWTPGETNALARTREFLEEDASHYEEERNRPDHPGTSRLSPHLHWGEVSPRTIWHQTQLAMARNSFENEGLSFLREIAWREFSYHLLYHHPSLPEEPLRPEFQNFPWVSNEAHLRAWQRGQTGYPIVDAGMHELWHTGWMHNRVRMIVASFLIKDLLIHWKEGEAWFWETLVDADLANNSASWQWVAGSGADASPYFRVFNPILQGEKFDPQGEYVRKWIPELIKLPNKWIHKPFEAPQEILKAASVEIGKNYPKPLVDHNIARKMALSAYQEITRKITKRAPVEF